MGGLGMFGAFWLHFVFFCKILPIFPFLQNEVNEIPGENRDWGGLEKLGGPPDDMPPHPIANVWLCHWYPVMCH